MTGATIYNSDIQKRIIEEAKLQISKDIVPQQLAEKVVPVLISNPKGKKRLIIYEENNTGNMEDHGLYVPVGKKWKILNMWAKLVTDATVSDRRFTMYSYSTGNLATEDWGTAADTVQPASKNFYYIFVKGIIPGTTALAEGTSVFHYLNLPEGYMFEGGNIWTTTSNLEDGDNLKIVILIEETDLLLDEYEFKAVP